VPDIGKLRVIFLQALNYPALVLVLALQRLDPCRQESPLSNTRPDRDAFAAFRTSAAVCSDAALPLLLALGAGGRLPHPPGQLTETAGRANLPLMYSGVFSSIRIARMRIGPMLPIGRPILPATSE
jgi:hypothetical protein